MSAIRAIAQVVLLEMLRRKDLYALLVLLATVGVVLGMGSVYGDRSSVRYVREISLGMIWLAMLAIAVTSAARQLPNEQATRTLLSLLAKPVSRFQVLAGKWLGCWLACGVALTGFYALFGLLDISRGGSVPWASALQAAWLHWVFCGVVVSLGLLGSVVFAAPSSNATIVILAVGCILFVGEHLRKLALRLDWGARTLLEGVYFALPHLEFYDVRDLLTHGWAPLPWTAIALDTVYGTAWTALLLGLAWLGFRRRPLA